MDIEYVDTLILEYMKMWCNIQVIVYLIVELN